MTLRIMLLGLVASMGFELPSGAQVSCWTQSGRDWVLATAADRSVPEVEADRPDAGLADCHQAEAPAPIERSIVAVEPKADDDSAFVAASEAMAADFAADLMTMREERAPAEDVPAMLAVASPPVGLPDGEELSVPPSPADEVVLADVVASDDVPAEATVAIDEPPSRADRVSNAIRLTRDAARAWADLMIESAEDASFTR